MVGHHDSDMQFIFRPVIVLAAFENDIACPNGKDRSLLGHEGYEMRFVISLQMRKVAAIEGHGEILTRVLGHPTQNNCFSIPFRNRNLATNHVGAGALARSAGRSRGFVVAANLRRASLTHPDEGVRVYAVRGACSLVLASANFHVRNPDYAGNRHAARYLSRSERLGLGISNFIFERRQHPAIGSIHRPGSRHLPCPLRISSRWIPYSRRSDRRPFPLAGPGIQHEL